MNIWTWLIIGIAVVLSAPFWLAALAILFTMVAGVVISVVMAITDRFD